MSKTILTFTIILLSNLFIHAQVGNQKNNVKEEPIIESLSKKIKNLQDTIKAYRKDSKTNPKDYYSAFKSYEIIIDFDKRIPFRVPKNIRKGDFYNLKITSFNPNRYNVVLSNKDSIISTALSTPTFGDISLDALTALTSSFTTESTVKLSDVFSDSIKMKNFSENLFLENKKQNDSIYKHFSLFNYGEILSNIENDLKEKLSQNEKIIKEIKTNIELKKNTLDFLKFDLYKFRLERFRKLPSEKVKEYNYEVALAKFQTFRKSIQELILSLDNGKSAYVEYIKKNEKIKDFLEKNKKYKELSDKVISGYDLSKTTLSKLYDIVNADNTNKLLKSIIFLHTGKNEYLSFPFQFKGEQEKVEISFVPKDSTSGLSIQKVGSFVFPVKKNTYWSVGTSFYHSNLKNERYSSILSSDSLYQIKRENNLDRELGISVNIRVGRKIRNRKLDKLGYHISFGPGISIEKNVRPRLLTGIGFSYGRKHNLVFDFGAIFGFVDRKSEALDLSKKFIEVPNTTVTDLEIGNYFSIGYTFNL